MACNQSPGITIGFSGSASHSVRFDQFTGETPRSFSDAASASFSASGALVQSGNSRKARRLWTIASHVKAAEVYALEALYLDWDEYRASGAAAAVSVSDETRVPDPNYPILANAVFTAAPAVSGGANGALLYVVSFSLLEV